MNKHAPKAAKVYEIPKRRVDHLLIADLVDNGSRVLDIGCSDGALLQLLRTNKNIDGRGIEISQKGVNLCVAKGLSVVHGNADHDLVNYPDNAFDFAILSQTIQATYRPKHVLEQLLRISKKAIVSFPNFGHWYIRTQFFFSGHMPVTTTLPKTWYETENIHLCTFKDFVQICNELEASVDKVIALNNNGYKVGVGLPLFLKNLIAEQGVFLLKPKA
ncbi:MAG: methionine biosynthesis protein MetW [Pseudomonadota bacterium]